MPHSKIPRGRHIAALIVLPALAFAGCATTSQSSEPAAQARAVARQWQSDLVDQDFDAALALVDPEFHSEAWPAKADLAYYFQQARERGYFEDAHALSDDMKVELKDGEAVVNPVPIRARLGTVVYALTLKRRDDTWTIASMTQELY